jgi:hypothetical protein
VLFADGDVAFAPDYFVRLSTQTDWDAMYGPKLSRDAYRWYYALVAQAQQTTHALAGIAAASGSNLLIRPAVLRALGGFREPLRCNEDSELLFRAARRGYRVRFAPELVVYAQDHRRLMRAPVLRERLAAAGLTFARERAWPRQLALLFAYYRAAVGAPGARDLLAV